MKTPTDLAIPAALQATSVVKTGAFAGDDNPNARKDHK
jgi:hypothetical protein